MSDDTPIEVRIPYREPDQERPFPDVVLAWPTSVDGLVVAYTDRWSVTHAATGMGLGGGPWCCLAHAREWVDALDDLDWAFTTVEEWEGRDIEPYLEAVRNAGDTWRCEFYEDLVTPGEAVTVVAHGAGLDAETVRQVLDHARERRVMALRHDCPEVDW